MKKLLELQLAIEALNEWYGSHATVNTAFGEQKTDAGYELRCVEFSFKGNIVLTVFNKGRINDPNEEDTQLLMGDEVVFVYDKKTEEIMTIEAMEQKSSETESWLTKCQDRISIPSGMEYLDDAIYDTIEASFERYGYEETYSRMGELAKDLKNLKGEKA